MDGLQGKEDSVPVSEPGSADAGRTDRQSERSDPGVEPVTA